MPLELPSLSAYLSLDGEYLVDELDDEVRIWSMANGTEIAHLRLATEGRPYALDISTKSKYIVTYSLAGQTAQVWQLPDGKEVMRVTGGGQTSTPFVLSPDERYLAVVSDDQIARVWELSSGKEILHIKVSPVENVPAFGVVKFYSVAFSQNGQYLAVTGDNIARVYHIPSGEEVKRIVYEEDETKVRNAIFSSDGKYLALVAVVGISDPTLQIWKLDEPFIVDPIGGSVNYFSISRDGEYIATDINTGDEHAQILQINKVNTKQEIIRTNQSGPDFLVSLLSPGNIQVFSPNGQYFAIKSNRDTIQVFELSRGQEIARITDSMGIDFYIFSPDNKNLITLSGATVNTWDIHSGKQIKSTSIRVNNLDSLLLSPDGKYYLENGHIIDFDRDLEYGYLSLRTITDGEEVTLIKLEKDFQLHNILFSPDGKYIAGIAYYFSQGSSTRSSRFIKVWEAVGGKEVIGLTLERDARGIALSPDGRYLSAALIDDTYRVWEISSKSEIIRIPNKGRSFFMTFTADSEYLAGVESTYNSEANPAKNIIRLWSIHPEKEACSYLNRNLTAAEWEQYVKSGTETFEDYTKNPTCPGLPVEK